MIKNKSARHSDDSYRLDQWISDFIESDFSRSRSSPELDIRCIHPSAWRRMQSEVLETLQTARAFAHARNDELVQTSHIEQALFERYSQRFGRKKQQALFFDVWASVVANFVWALAVGGYWFAATYIPDFAPKDLHLLAGVAVIFFCHFILNRQFP